MLAADLAGVTVLQLFNAPMATALNYGMFRRKDINTTAKHMMFYDMGSAATSASVVSFQVIKSKERGFTESHPQAQILGIRYDLNLHCSHLSCFDWYIPNKHTPLKMFYINMQYL